MIADLILRVEMTFAQCPLLHPDEEYGFKDKDVNGRGNHGQPAFAVYERTGADPRWTAHSIHVLAIEDDMISTLTLFVPPAGPRLFHAFGLPLSLPDAASAELPSTPHHS